MTTYVKLCANTEVWFVYEDIYSFNITTVISECVHYQNTTKTEWRKGCSVYLCGRDSVLSSATMCQLFNNRSESHGGALLTFVIYFFLIENISVFKILDGYGMNYGL